MEDWTVQSVLVLIGGILATAGLWGLFLWHLSRDDMRR